MGLIVYEKLNRHPERHGASAECSEGSRAAATAAAARSPQRPSNHRSDAQGEAFGQSGSRQPLRINCPECGTLSTAIRSRPDGVPRFVCTEGHILTLHSASGLAEITGFLADLADSVGRIRSANTEPVQPTQD